MTRGNTDQRTDEEGIVATVNEAAFVSGVSRHAVNQAIDRGEIRARPRLRSKTDAPGRTVGVAELIYLYVAEHLSTSGRRTLYQQLVRVNVDVESVPPAIELEGGARLDITASVAEVRARLEAVGRIKTMVEENPEIRGGEAVFRGTRIPVQMVAGFVKEGIPAEEILEDYPALTPESLEAAALYVELYPRRGRPRQAPWRARVPTHVLNPEDLRG